MHPSLLLSLTVLLLLSTATAIGMLRVRHKFGPGRAAPLADLHAHDARRHARILSAVDLNLGGKGSPSDAGLYYAEIGIGTPPKNYYVQVDTGSDIMWVNCASCTACPHKSDLKIELTQYDLKRSNSGNKVMCNQGFCTSMFGKVSKCDGTASCQFKIGYGDGSETTGFFVSDVMQYDRVTGNHMTSSDNAALTFGVDDGFPSVTFHFENALLLSVYPHDYLFLLSDNFWCVGWQASVRETKFLLGDILLSNKLVVYDLEKQVIGWTDYNCSGSIKVQDEESGAVYTVDAHSVSSAELVETGGSLIFLLITVAFCM